MSKFKEALQKALKHSPERLEAVNSAIDGLDLDDIFNPIVDSAVSTGVETNRKTIKEKDFPIWFEEQYKKRLQEEHPELNPSDADKRLAALEKEIADSKEREKRLSIKNVLMQKYKLPEFMSYDSFIQEDEAASIKSINSFMDIYSKHIKDIEDKAFAEAAKKYNMDPTGGNGDASSPRAKAISLAEQGDIKGALKTIFKEEK